MEFSDGGIVRSTITTSTRVPDCRTSVSDHPLFDDGLPEEWADSDGIKRYGCVYRPPGASASSPRPLVLYFHGSGGSAQNVYNNTRLREKALDFDLSGDAARPGFILASVQGRYLHWPTSHSDATHHDTYFRHPTNPDVVNTDRLIDALVAENRVDPQRIYVMGWSNGAAFAELYALLRHGAPTPGGNRVAAGAVYAFYNPYENLSATQTPSCELNPYPTSTAPLYLLVRACDALTACSAAQEAAFGLPPGYGAETWVGQLATGVGNPNVTFQIITGAGVAVTACAPVALCTETTGTINHLRWPDGLMDGSGNDWEVPMLAFLRAHPHL